MTGLRPEVRIDWIRLRGQEAAVQAAVGWGRKYWGEPREGRGLLHFERGAYFATGFKVLWGGDRQQGAAIVELTGDVLEEWTVYEQLERLAELGELGFRICRHLDIAIDFRRDDGGRVGLIDAVLASSKAGELCYLGRMREVRDDDTRTGELRGRSVYLGVRGGNGRHVCCYDKGLESGKEAEGVHERWEMRASGDAAMVAWAWLQRSEMVAENVCELVREDSQIGRLLSLALGACDFRVKTGAANRSVKRRPRVAWWDALVSYLGWCRLRLPPRGQPSFERYANAFAKQHAGTIRGLIKVAGGDVSQVLEDIGVLGAGVNWEKGNKSVLISYSQKLEVAA